MIYWYYTNKIKLANKKKVWEDNLVKELSLIHMLSDIQMDIAFFIAEMSR